MIKKYLRRLEQEFNRLFFTNHIYVFRLELGIFGVPTVVQQVKDLVLLQLWHRLHVCLKFDPWPRNFHTPRVWSNGGKKKGVGKYSLPREDLEWLEGEWVIYRDLLGEFQVFSLPVLVCMLVCSQL